MWVIAANGPWLRPCQTRSPDADSVLPLSAFWLPPILSTWAHACLPALVIVLRQEEYFEILEVAGRENLFVLR